MFWCPALPTQALSSLYSCFPIRCIHAPILHCHDFSRFFYKKVYTLSTMRVYPTFSLSALWLVYTPFHFFIKFCGVGMGGGAAPRAGGGGGAGASALHSLSLIPHHSAIFCSSIQKNHRDYMPPVYKQQGPYRANYSQKSCLVNS